MKNITKPTLLLDEQKCKSNIRSMVHKTSENNVNFRPHFKTHQSLEIGRWFKEQGVSQITVSSVSMAQYFASEWDDILIAFPVNVLEIDSINKLTQQITLSLLVENIEAIEFLNKNLDSSVGFYIKIDAGYHRTGVDAGNHELIDLILQKAAESDKLRFIGFLSHAGHTYHTKTIEEIFKIRNDENLAMLQLKAKYIRMYPDLITSIGDTPSCSLADHFSGIDEIRPGYFVFYDLMKLNLGVCNPEQVAIAMACPVVALHKDRNEMVIYGGGAHLSKDTIQVNGTAIYGQVAKKEENAWGKPIRQMVVKRVSQEHGIIHVPNELAGDYSVGDLVYVLPVHSCMTADIYSKYLTLENNEIRRF
jgi:D-serine deaminase-like pyridoxal phosphate-dependent protein